MKKLFENTNVQVIFVILFLISIIFLVRYCYIDSKEMRAKCNQACKKENHKYGRMLKGSTCMCIKKDGNVTYIDMKGK